VIDCRSDWADTRGVIRKFNDSFAHMPAWIGAAIAGVLTFASMTALFAVDGTAHPLVLGAICGCGVALISFAARRAQQRRESRV